MSEVVSTPLGIEVINQRRGTDLRNQADRLTAFRDRYSPVLGLSVALDDGNSLSHTLTNTVTTAYFEYTDYVDGKKARKAAELLGEETTADGGIADEKADKKKFYSQILGLLFRTVVHEQDFAQSGFMAGVGTIQALRDIEMRKTRNTALDNDIQSKARSLGKYKTWANGVGNGLHTLRPAFPEKWQRHTKIAANAMLGIGTGLSVAALVDMKLHVNRELRTRTKTPEGDTSQVHVLESHRVDFDSKGQPELPYVARRSSN